MEQLISFKGMMSHLENIITRTTTEMDATSEHHVELKKDMTEMRKVIRNIIGKQKR